MEGFEDSLDILLVGLYRDINDLEENMLAATNMNLSISEIHMLEAVCKAGRDGVATISDISEFLGISLPSVTLAINKLAKKEFVIRQKSPNDGRVVQVLLTRKGHKAERAHQYFHRSMVREISRQMTEGEKEVLMSGIHKLDAFLKKNIQRYINK